MMPVKIGPYVLPSNVVLAPMAGVTDRPFRQLCRRFGATLAPAEMLSADQRLWTSGKSQRRMDPAGEPEPRVVQLVGSEPAELAAAVQDITLPGVLADFIGEGHYVRHVRRVRALCAERQQALLAAAAHDIGDAMRLEPDAAGLHMVGWLPPRASDQSATAWAAREGVDVMPLSRYSAIPPTRGALLLGYAAFDDAEIRVGIQKLARALVRER